MDKNKISSPARISYIDFLKFIGLTGIIIAHVGSPNWLIQLRSFDVPLMVILSSMLGVHSFRKYSGTQNGLFAYWYSRIKRLVFPAWIFLIIYFGLKFLTSGELYSFKYYLASFCLTRYGIGYVWIILIYLYSAMMIPLYSKIGFSKRNTVYLAVIYLLYELLYYYRIGSDNKLIETTFYYMVPYGGLLTYLGYNCSRIKRKEPVVLISVSVFILSGIYYWHKAGHFQLVNIVKFPPRFYYLSFGIAVSTILLILCEGKDCKLFRHPVITYISCHSMWIYLWHILVLDLYKYTGFPNTWYIKLPVVYIGAAFIVFAVNKALDIIEKYRHIAFLTYFRG